MQSGVRIAITSGEDFDGDVAIEGGVAGPVDLAHTAGAQGADDFGTNRAGIPVRAKLSGGGDYSRDWGLWSVSGSVELVSCKAVSYKPSAITPS